MKMLVPVDGSAASINAVKKAIEIAKKYGNFSIKIVNVVNIDHISGYKRNKKLWSQVDGSIISENDEKTKLLEEHITASSHKILKSLIEKLDFAGIKTETEVIIGEPYEKILETAKNENFDLIVMGNRGFSKIKRFFVGSVTQRVISDAPCPVLVIHSDMDI
ncbi:MAG: universal stress protein [Sedimentibacter sp.]|uniref:universal stress protein n=1 Tax=Sedimentibacter sp. TaxID=1960295 RepID=UPI0031592251